MTTGRPLLATYRLQVHKEFPLEQARKIVPYLERLGISHMYSSPQLRARSGSTHGYDVVDPLTLNPEIGTENDRRSLVDTLHGVGMGLILDIVPNHMGVGKENPYWQNVLMHGPSSVYACWFDIDWGAGRAIARTRVLLPVLGKELTEAVDAGEIGVAREDGSFRITYFDNWFPVDPATISDILNHDIAHVRSALGDDDPDLREFDEIVDGLSSMPPRWSTEEGSREERRRRSDATKQRLSALLDRAIIFREHVARATKTFAAGAEGHRRLKTLLGMQAYELAFWQHAAKRINYRRFFDISDLAGLKVEDPGVFADTHRLVLEWIADGSLDGVRVDHIDGLFDPLGYLERVRAMADSLTVAGADFPIFVEKILSPGERLRETWPVQGTTGYEFLNDLTAVFVSPAGSQSLDETFREQLKLTDRHMNFASVAYEGKMRVLAGSLRPDVLRVARAMKPLTKGFADARSLGSAVEKSVVAFVASLPVYRTYIDDRSVQAHPDDATVIERSLDDIRERKNSPDEVRERMRELFLSGDSADRDARMQAIGRLQQLSGPATAKGIEDTALYRYIPLASLNEVGSAPDRNLTTGVTDFHRTSRLRAEKWPLNLLCTNTHDTKRSADVRSRLHVLAEIPEEWAGAIGKWRRAHASLRTTLGRRAAPDAVTEYLLYQTLVGLWPLGGKRQGADEIESIRKRVEAYMIKAAREAKSRTSWTNPDQEFEAALKAFLAAILEEGRSFGAELTALVSKIARPGMWNALSRLVLHLTAPGTPDIYQGDELWNFSLVDPDNRRPVDYEERDRTLAELEKRFGDGDRIDTSAVKDMLQRAEDGRLKLYLTWRVLHARRNHAEVFRGSYEPIEAPGSTGEHVVAFVREGGGRRAVTIASRLPVTLTGSTDAPTGAVWRDGSLKLPAGNWRCVISGIEVTSAGEPIPLGTLLGALPVGLFITQ